jgi:hypothetical protein
VTVGCVVGIFVLGLGDALVLLVFGVLAAVPFDSPFDGPEQAASAATAAAAAIFRGHVRRVLVRSGAVIDAVASVYIWFSN